MTDIVDRLRFLSSGQDDPHSVAIAEAADALDAQAKEIERLSGINSDLCRKTNGLTIQSARDAERIEALRAEVAALRDVAKREIDAATTQEK